MASPVTVNPADHLTFGVGIHACVGQNLAELEAQAFLTALLARVRPFEIGKPEFVVNNTLLGLSRLPCRIVTRARGNESSPGLTLRPSSWRYGQALFASIGLTRPQAIARTVDGQRAAVTGRNGNLPAYEPNDHALGRSRGGLTTKGHLGRGRPRRRPDHAVVDRAYASRGLRAYLRKGGTARTLPEKRDRQRHRRSRGRDGGRTEFSVRPPFGTPPSGHRWLGRRDQCRANCTCVACATFGSTARPLTVSCSP
ncbi:cytochrome P450 [Streptomyces sp. 3213.3]|uniref:cytochrome P450 n=1 Tax=Streptomyces sp. 3213.3 TaxID=1855348 RepID=UPI003FA7092D